MAKNYIALFDQSLDDNAETYLINLISRPEFQRVTAPDLKIGVNVIAQSLGTSPADLRSFSFASRLCLPALTLTLPSPIFIGRLGKRDIANLKEWALAFRRADELQNVARHLDLGLPRHNSWFTSNLTSAPAILNPYLAINLDVGLQLDVKKMQRAIKRVVEALRI